MLRHAKRAAPCCVQREHVLDKGEGKKQGQKERKDERLLLR
jgi:hypothetical protein